MICPKCQDLMHTVNRSEIHFEQCGGCRGIFLDHGELEQIVRAENHHYAAAPQYLPPPGAPAGYPGHYADSPPPHRGHHGHYYADSPPPYGHGGYRGRRRSFLEQLFD
ncbi:MAG: zf-TFIIB domain-containing protein [Pseudonocardiaceae bacterium]